MLSLSCQKEVSQEQVLERFQTSLVEIELTRKLHNYRLPWVTGQKIVLKNGLVLTGNRILTTADDVSGALLVRVQKDGEAKRYDASLEWVDYYANLAVLNVADDAFWKGLEPVQLASTIPQSGELNILRWRNGRLEARAAEIERLFVGKSQTSYVEYPQLEVTSEIGAAGWAEVVVQQGRVVGLTASANGKSLRILPSELILKVLEARKKSPHGALAYMDFVWQPGTNPDLLRSLGLDSTDQGIIINITDVKRIAPQVLLPGDVITDIAGFPIDVEGKYRDPDYGRLPFQALATRNVMAGDTLKMTVWREQKKISVDYVLPAAVFSNDLVPDAEYDLAPEYLIAGGFVYQSVIGPYLAAHGANAPFLLKYYDYRRPVTDRNSLVVISGVLPDPYNRGYEDHGQLIVDRINDRPISTVQDVAEALKNPLDGFHVVRFFPDQLVRTLIMDSTSMDLSTARVLERYRIPEDRYFRN